MGLPACLRTMKPIISSIITYLLLPKTHKNTHTGASHSRVSQSKLPVARDVHRIDPFERPPERFNFDCPAGRPLLSIKTTTPPGPRLGVDRWPQKVN